MSCGQSVRRRRPRGGFAMATTVVLLSIAAITVTILAATFAIDVRRTKAVAEEVQLGELLHAGGEEEIARVKASAGKELAVFVLPLPAELKGCEVKVIVTTDEKRSGLVTVRASHGGRYLEEEMHFELREGVWLLAGVQMGNLSAERGE